MSIRVSSSTRKFVFWNFPRKSFRRTQKIKYKEFSKFSEALPTTTCLSNALKFASLATKGEFDNNISLPAIICQQHKGQEAYNERRRFEICRQGKRQIITTSSIMLVNKCQQTGVRCYSTQSFDKNSKPLPITDVQSSNPILQPNGGDLRLRPATDQFSSTQQPELDNVRLSITSVQVSTHTQQPNEDGTRSLTTSELSSNIGLQANNDDVRSNNYNQLCKEDGVRLGISSVPYLSQSSVYIHWPYCRQLCSYCNFVKFVPKKGTRWTIDDDVLERVMVEELQQVLRASHVQEVTSVYFGGGTPSLARPHLVQRVLEGVEHVCRLRAGAEVTLEGNPSSLTQKSMQDFISAGVNRLSIGVQSFERVALSALHRDHTVTEAVHCLEVARRLLPGRVSLDLLFARPGQTLERWEKELQMALQLCDDHIALYQLTVEAGTPLHKNVSTGKVNVPGIEEQADMYEAAVSLLTGSEGFSRYEVANFSRGVVSQSVHNKNYWAAGQYVGVGPGAHSRIVPRTVPQASWTRYSENYTRCKDYLIETAKGSDHSGDFLPSSIDCTGDCDDYFASSVGQSKMAEPKESNLADGHLKENCYLTTTKNNNMLKRTTNAIIREERINAPDPARWMHEVNKKGNGVLKVVGQTRADVLGEYLASGLRTTKGVTKQRWRQIDPNGEYSHFFSLFVDSKHHSARLELENIVSDFGSISSGSGHCASDNVDFQHNNMNKEHLCDLIKSDGEHVQGFNDSYCVNVHECVSGRENCATDPNSVQQFLELGLLRITENGLQPTDKGMNVIDSVLPTLLNVLNKNE